MACVKIQRWLVLALVAFWLGEGAATAAAIRAGDFEATFSCGSLQRLESAGKVMVRPPAQAQGMGIHRIAGPAWASAAQDTGAAMECSAFDGLPGAAGTCTIQPDAANGELCLRQRAASPAKGVWGVSWSIGEIPLEYAILVPGNSGLRLTATSPGARHEFDYPIGWEAQLVVVEGPEHGFFVWAEDAQGRFKRLVVERRATGWRLGLITLADAPFDEQTACESVTWRLGSYRGDWRTAARRYRQWAEANLRPTPVASQRPSWVRDIRACVIMGLDRKLLEELPRRFDPRQTLLYLPDWRQAGYDRDYPEYDKLLDGLDPFVGAAHARGFRVMLHVNYFGVDPLNPLYARFEPYQVRDPFGKHEKQWWLWERATPPIRFAYINPAFKGWRDEFTARMVKLCRRTGTDALHLDQTLCIYNDHHGRIDRMSMLEGSLALHRQLREALPEVALSGEGLNEVTCRYEAFAQRHVAGIDHANGRYDRRWLAMAHPISSYLLRPYTVIYGYLGCTPPENDQLYAAWQEAYRHWGVIPTAWAQSASVRAPTGFARQFYDEVAFWQGSRLEIDMDGPWPADVAFPYRTGTGQPAAHTADRRLVCGSQPISRTLTGAAQFEVPGTVPGWLAYDQRQLFGLDPQCWYPCFAEPRDPNALHVAEMPAGLSIDGVLAEDAWAMIRTVNRPRVIAELAEQLHRATCGVRPYSGAPREQLGPLSADAADGAHLHEDGERLAAHPPWKIAGSGLVFARYTLDLPGAQKGLLQFTSEVAMDEGAVGPGKSDGVTFDVTASAGERRLHAELHHATAERRPLCLDLTPLAGQRATIELAVGPGPNRSPSFDWARWHRPRIEWQAAAQGAMCVAGGKAWPLALDARGECPIVRSGDVQRVEAAMPGTLFLLASRPEAVRVPVDVASRPFHVAFFGDGGQSLRNAPHAAMHRGANVVAGVRREGFFAHPPDHGHTVAHFFMTLPTQPLVFRCWVGVRDSSTSDGVLFVVQLNGREVARRRMLPGRWEPLSADLPVGSGESPCVLTLLTDSDGPFNCDWACWGQPRIETK